MEALSSGAGVAHPTCSWTWNCSAVQGALVQRHLSPIALTRYGAIPVREERTEVSGFQA